MLFRASLPCRTVAGTIKAFALRILPPGAEELDIQKLCPATISGRVRAYPPGSGETPKTFAFKGNPLRATTTVSTVQSLETQRSPGRPRRGASKVSAPETLCRTSKSEDE